MIHPDLIKAQKSAYEPFGLILHEIHEEKESKDYGAYDFLMNNLRIKCRVAKITPNKKGLFVTLWKRNGKGPILPFDRADPIDFFVISVRNESQLGQFVFSKKVLCDRGIVSIEGIGGKRAIRVYPPWDTADNNQAQKTQLWQREFFFGIDPQHSLDPLQIQKLFQK